MSFVLVFDRTGDEICFDPVNQEVLEFYIERLNHQSLNCFVPELPEKTQYLVDLLNGLHSTVLEVNKWLFTLFDIKINEHTVEDYLDQQNLNKIHADWVVSQQLTYDIQKKREQFNFSEIVERIHDLFPDNIQHPPLMVVLDKLGLSKKYNSINSPYVHGIEEFFTNIRYTSGNSWTKLCDNPFSKSLLTNNTANICISFNHLGRTRYNKFLFFDKQLHYKDENTYDELLNFVSLNLQPAQTIPLSKEYVSWCNANNIEPVGDFLNIGNIPNLYENLTKYRIIIFRNLLNNHGFSIHKTKG